ncbi:hypothetical protein MMC14_002960 [Varicellaria rhodocarpa]|nr:hypothetical protein [Varicellaria rhodocarpa]
MADGTPFNVSLADLDGFVSYNLNISIIYASQLGASLVLLVVMALVTKPEKRSVPINVLNVLSLAFNFVRNILNCLYYTGAFSDIYAYYAQDFSRVPKSAYGNSIAAVVLTVLNLICVEGSLLLQSQVVCLTLRKVYRQTILAISILIASLAIALRLALCIENSKAIMAAAIEDSLTWLVTVANITTSISVFWFCIVFVVKLGFAIHQRRKLGLRRFGPLQILFIVGCQTLVIPAIFSVLEYTVEIPAMDSNVLTLVSIFLPLSSLWAASSTDGRSQQQAPLPQIQGRCLDNKGHKSNPSFSGKSGKELLTPSTTAGIRTIPSPPPSPSKELCPYDTCVDLEAQNEKSIREI